MKRIVAIVPMSDEVYQEKKTLDQLISDVLRKYVDDGVEPFVWTGKMTGRVALNLVECHVCTKKVNLTRVGRVMHWHKDNRFTKYGKWGLKCPGSGKAPKRG